MYSILIEFNFSLVSVLHSRLKMHSILIWIEFDFDLHFVFRILLHLHLISSYLHFFGILFG